MITRRMTAKEARDNFADLLGAVYYGKEPVIVEKKGRPFAVVINPEEYLRYQKITKDKFFKTTKQIQMRNADFDEKEVLSDITRAVEDIRKRPNAKKK